MPTDSFKPRAATLRYAALAQEFAAVPGDGAREQSMANALNAIAFGLVYVGDQIAKVHLELWEARTERVSGEMVPDGTYAGARGVDDGDAGD